MVSTTVKNASNSVLKPFPAHLRKMRATEVPDALGLNIVLFGVPGVGKTTLAATAQDSPYGQNVLFIDVEGGTRSISDRTDIDVVRPDNINDVKQIYDWLAAEPNHGYKTIVIDTLPELQRVGMKEIMQTAKNPEMPQFQDWQKSTEQIMRMVRAFRNLAQTRGWNVIFTAHAREQKDTVTGAVLIRPSLTPSASDQVTGAVDVVGYLRREQNGDRTLLLQPTNTIVAKYRQPLTGNILPPIIKNPTLPAILSHMRGEIQIPTVEVDNTVTISDSVDDHIDDTG